MAPATRMPTKSMDASDNLNVRVIDLETDNEFVGMGNFSKLPSVHHLKCAPNAGDPPPTRMAP